MIYGLFINNIFIYYIPYLIDCNKTLYETNRPIFLLVFIRITFSYSFDVFLFHYTQHTPMAQSEESLWWRGKRAKLWDRREFDI